MMPNLDDIADLMDQFVERQGWTEAGSSKPQTGRSLAISMAIEASEVLQCYQWGETAELERLRDELADVLLYMVRLARVEGIDLLAAAAEKLQRNNSRTWASPGGRP